MEQLCVLELNVDVRNYTDPISARCRRTQVSHSSASSTVTSSYSTAEMLLFVLILGGGGGVDATPSGCSESLPHCVTLSRMKPLKMSALLLRTTSMSPSFSTSIWSASHNGQRTHEHSSRYMSLINSTRGRTIPCSESDASCLVSQHGLGDPRGAAVIALLLHRWRNGNHLQHQVMTLRARRQVLDLHICINSCQSILAEATQLQ